jgi:hypothetical protein
MEKADRQNYGYQGKESRSGNDNGSFAADHHCVEEGDVSRTPQNAGDESPRDARFSLCTASQARGLQHHQDERQDTNGEEDLIGIRVDAGRGNFRNDPPGTPAEDGKQGVKQPSRYTGNCGAQFGLGIGSYDALPAETLEEMPEDNGWLIVKQEPLPLKL